MRITVKLGGSILEDAGIRTPLLSQVSTLRARGHEIILVHGGGKRLSRRLNQMQIDSYFSDGLRVTDAETLDVAIMVLAGEVNKRLVAEMSQLGTKAVGICGADAGAVRCVRLSDFPGCPADLGFVGKPTEVNEPFFDLIVKAGLVPIVSSISLGSDSGLYNVNADQMAATCASGTHCSCLVYLTDVAGVMDENGCVLPRIGKAEIEDMRSRGTLRGGMLPKTASCLEALAAGVTSVHILPGSSPDILCRFIDGKAAEGTNIHEND